MTSMARCLTADTLCDAYNAAIAAGYRAAAEAALAMLDAHLDTRCKKCAK